MKCVNIRKCKECDGVIHIKYTTCRSCGYFDQAYYDEIRSEIKLIKKVKPKKKK